MSPAALGTAGAIVLLTLAPPARAVVDCSPLDSAHAGWTAVLQDHLSGEDVDYAGLHADSSALDAYLGALESVCAADYQAWTEDQQIAFWLNAYNAYTVRLILDNYPVDSIRDIGLLPLAAFRKDFIDLQVLGDDPMSLGQIEHKILRARYTEPRIHFALVCASESCPPLRPEAYRAADLDHQLDDQARTFLRDPAKNRYDADQGVLYLSKIFSWFEGDFEAHSASVSAYVEPYLLVEAGQAVRSGDVPIRYLPYDWSLNGR